MGVLTDVAENPRKSDVGDILGCRKENEIYWLL